MHEKRKKGGGKMDFLTTTTHLHVTTWVVAVVLFLVAAVGIKPKVVHMILRLFYILALITGGALFFEYRSAFGFEYDIKFLLGILVIAMMEMILVRQKKNKPTTVFWVLFAIFLFAVLYYGFKLPMGMDFLA